MSKDEFDRDVARLVAHSRREVFLNTVYPGTNNKKFRDCTAADVRGIAKAFNRLANKMGKKATISELFAEAGAD